MQATKIWPSPKIVVIGGGTGTSTILKGLKKQTEELTAIISVMDDGGSTGRLRKDLDLIAVGDLRACLLSLANAENNMDQLLNYRFREGDLAGHNFGNIFIAAMNGIYSDFSDAIAMTAKILNITGKVLPITLDNANLVARLSNGQVVKGESKIGQVNHVEKTKILEISTDPGDIYMLDEAKEAIKQADLVILGPGSLYTSVIPNLLAKGMVDLLYQTKAKVVYVSNIMCQIGETENYSVKDHYEAIIRHSREGIIDYVVVNKADIDPDLLEVYRQASSDQVIISDEDRDFFASKKVKLIEANIAKVYAGLIRHDSDELAKVIVKEIYMQES
ncbi:MAG: YvcK family protein [Tissierellia bacterium]|nr:YvcK family protein [Tissierellia bacterium]